MTRQWIRKCRVVVEGSGTSIDVSDLRVRFSVEQNNIQRPNAAEITITNLSSSTAGRLRQQGKKVTLDVGYDGELRTIFRGDIIQCRVGRDNPVDTYCAIVATDGDKAYNYGVVNKTLAAGHTFRDQVNAAYEVLQPFGITLGYISDLGSRTMPRARVLFGMARNVLRDVAFATGTSWSIQGGKLQILKNTDPLPGQAVVLNSRTGLIGMPVQTFNGILARCLLNPTIVPGSLVQIDQSSVQTQAFSPNYTAEVQNSMLPSVATDGFYKVLVVDHQGDTRGNNWYSDLTLLDASGKGPVPINLARQGINVDPDQP